LRWTTGSSFQPWVSRFFCRPFRGYVCASFSRQAICRDGEVELTSRTVIKAAYIGIHDIDVPKDLSPTAGLEWNFGAGLSYRPILGLAKMSALFFLLRLGQHSNRLVLFIWTQIWLNVAFSLSILLMFIFGCDPISHNWDMSSLGMQCFNGRYYALYSSVSTIFTDFLVLMVPFWILKDIRLAFKVKAAILAIFLLGLL